MHFSAFLLALCREKLLAATLIGVQWSQNKQAGRKVSACCAGLQVPLSSYKQPVLDFNFPTHVSLFATSFHGNEISGLC